MSSCSDAVFQAERTIRVGKTASDEDDEGEMRDLQKMFGETKGRLDLLEGKCARCKYAKVNTIKQENIEC